MVFLVILYDGILLLVLRMFSENESFRVIVGYKDKNRDIEGEGELFLEDDVVVLEYFYLVYNYGIWSVVDDRMFVLVWFCGKYWVEL